MLSGTRRIAVCSILLWLAIASAAYAQDTVTTATGEKIVGEIKSVEKDILTIETPYSDSDFKIKWSRWSRSTARANSWSRRSTGGAWPAR